MAMTRNAIIDGWRGLSVLMVLVGHLNVSRLGKEGRGIPFQRMLNEPFDWFAFLANAALRITYWLPDTGVQIFFVISGYLITSLLLREEDLCGKISIPAFYVRRFFRIVPAYAVFLLVALALGQSGAISLGHTDVSTAAAFLCNTTVHLCSWGVAHTWTLAVEEQFYLGWPFLFVLFGSRYRVAGLIVTIAFLLTLSAVGWLRVDGWIDNSISFATIGIGALYATSKLAQRFVSTHAKSVALLLAGGLILARPFLSKVPGYELLLPFVIGFVFFGSLQPGNWLGLTLSWKPLRNVGLISYSLYLWQQLFTFPLQTYPEGSWLSFPLLAFGLAAVSFLCIERPMIKLGHVLSDVVGRGVYFSLLRGPYLWRGRHRP